MSRLKISHATLRELKRAEEAVEKVNTAALTSACLASVTPYLTEWVLAPLSRAIREIEGTEDTQEE